MRHISNAICTAQWIGLDQLGSDPLNAPVNDLAFSQSSRFVAFEISKRLFHMLSFLDGTSWKYAGQWRLANAMKGGIMTANFTGFSTDD